MPNAQFHLGDCLDVMAGMPDASVDAICTDPPAGISFMGKEWDCFGGTSFKRNEYSVRDTNGYLNGSGGPTIEVAQKARRPFIDFLMPRLAECLRVAKPGARMLCWAIPRTSHWTGTAIEDAGWLIENRVSHIFGSGFPKGKGQLKPAVEDWWLARKPGGKVPELQIDKCRIEGVIPQVTQGVTRRAAEGQAVYGAGHDIRRAPQLSDPHPAGRWPANLVLSHHPDCVCVGTKRVKGTWGYSGPHDDPGGLKSPGWGMQKTGKRVGMVDSNCLETVAEWQCVDGCPVAELDAQSGVLNSHGGGTSLGMGYRGGVTAVRPIPRGDSGGPSRFFATFGYFPKASRRDRGKGNAHPTVKNTDLMRWLCRLITPEGGIVLDPFMGSGSTGVACQAEGFGFVGIEQDEHSFAVARRRIARGVPPVSRLDPPKPPPPLVGQLTLFGLMA